MDYTAIDNLDFDTLKKLYDKVPKDKVSTYNIPNWGTDDIGVIRKKLIAIYKNLELSDSNTNKKENTKEDSNTISKSKMGSNKED